MAASLPIWCTGLNLMQDDCPISLKIWLKFVPQNKNNRAPLNQKKKKLKL
jgi:hypothetical protein